MFRRTLYITFLIALLIGSVNSQSTMTDSVGDGGPALQAVLEHPSSVAVDEKGNIYITERRGNRIRRVDIDTGMIKTIAGTGNRSYSGDGGLATKADISIPEDIDLDSQGHLYFSDRGNSRVRRIDARTGIITMIAGTGTHGYSGDGGPATQADISSPYGVSLDPADNIFFADTENHRIRRIDAKTGIITTVAGNGEQRFSGDGGLATKASLSRPHILTISPNGDLIIGDSFNQRIRKVDQTTGVVTTIAGTGEEGFGGDGGPATGAKFMYIGALEFDKEGNLLLTDGANNRIRKIDSRTGRITTIVGTGESGFGGDGGPALQAKIKRPYGMNIDSKGNIFFADWQNNRVRRIDARSGIITTVAGRGGA